MSPALNKTLSESVLEAQEASHHKANFIVCTVQNFARAALLSGPPGIGKTSIARILARDFDYELIEFNASDDRGKSIIDSKGIYLRLHAIAVVSDMTSGGRSLNFNSQTSSRPEMLYETLVLMDEVDGLSAGDRGGVQALCKLIEKTRCPIICICNDRYNPKVRSLSQKCNDIPFHKPPKNTVAKRLKELLAKEGCVVDANAIELLCEHVGNDLRQILNTLQYLSGTTQEITYTLIKQSIDQGLKDQSVRDTMFDVARRLLIRGESAKLSLNDKQRCYFTDYDIIPLYMQENYLTAYSNHLKKHPEHHASATQLTAEVANSIAFSDILNRKCRRDGQWSLLGDIGFYSAIIPSCKMSGFVAFPEFPRWLGKNSATQKKKFDHPSNEPIRVLFFRRLLNELYCTLSPHCLLSPSALITGGYVDLLYAHAVDILVQREASPQDAAQKAADFLQQYSLTKDMLTEHLHLLKCDPKTSYDAVPTHVKRSLTSIFTAYKKSGRALPTLPKLKGPVDEVVEEPGSEEGPLISTPPQAVGSQDEEEDTRSTEIDQLILQRSKSRSAPTKKASKMPRQPRKSSKKAVQS